MGRPLRKFKFNSPHPVTKYWTTMEKMFEITQYSARPLGKEMLKKVNMIGIIQSISWLCCAVRGS